MEWRTDFEEAKSRKAVFLRNKWSVYPTLCVWDKGFWMWATLDHHLHAGGFFESPTHWAEAPCLKDEA